jgi:hypothetical protein
MKTSSCTSSGSTRRPVATPASSSGAKAAHRPIVRCRKAWKCRCWNSNGPSCIRPKTASRTIPAMFPANSSVRTASKAFPTIPRGRRSMSWEFRCKGKGEWNTYDVVCVDGTVKLSINGKFVNGISQIDRAQRLPLPRIRRRGDSFPQHQDHGTPRRPRDAGADGSGDKVAVIAPRDELSAFARPWWQRTSKAFRAGVSAVLISRERDGYFAVAFTSSSTFVVIRSSTVSV